MTEAIQNYTGREGIAPYSDIFTYTIRAAGGGKTDGFAMSDSVSAVRDGICCS